MSAAKNVQETPDKMRCQLSTRDTMLPTYHLDKKVLMIIITLQDNYRIYLRSKRRFFYMNELPLFF